MKINIDIGYPRKMLFENVEMNLPSEGIISIIGDNGSGKSTLFKTLTGIILPLKGNLPTGLSCNCAIVSDYVHLPEENKVRHLVRLVGNLTIFEKQYPQLSRFIIDQAEQKIKHLSSGQKRILEIIMALLSGKKIIILDEATNALDIKNKSIFIKSVKNLSQNGVLFLHTSHDLSEVLELSGKCFFIHKDEKWLEEIPKAQTSYETLNHLLEQEAMK